MKKTLAFLIAAATIFATLPLTAFAVDTADNYVFTYGDIEVSVPTDGVTEEEAKSVADSIARLEGIAVCGGLTSIDAEPHNLICSIAGHSLTTTYPTATVHKAYTDAPRCVQKDYEHQYCSRCDYTSDTLLKTTRIYCH